MPNVHPSDEILDEYAFNRLPQEDADQLEEHLMVCAHCQDRLELADQFRAEIRAALKKCPS